MTDGASGDCPDWYLLVRAARIYGVPPWELIDQPVWWVNTALSFESVEADVKQAMEKRASRKH